MENTEVDMVQKNMNIPTTYYGNGCTPIGGTDKPCETRIINTYDNEDQKNGTYYYPQALTAGSSGNSVTTDNTDSPDSFCPLGWQVPYGGTGGDYYNKSKSWNYLVVTYSLGQDESSSRKIRSYPFSYVSPGGLDGAVGKLYGQTLSGLYWTLTNKDTNKTYRINFWQTGIGTLVTEGNTKWYAYAFRCDFDISNLESFPWHPRKTLNILGFIKLLNEPEME